MTVGMAPPQSVTRAEGAESPAPHPEELPERREIAAKEAGAALARELLLRGEAWRLLG